MAKKTRKRKNSKKKTLARSLRARLREGLFIIVSTSALILFLALLTYHPEDPSWSFTGTEAPVNNIGGRLGAWFADIFLYFFGYMAYFFPFVIAQTAWLLFKARDEKAGIRLLYYFTRFLGGLLIVFAGAGVVSGYLSTDESMLPASSGGIVGGMLLNAFVQVVNPVGALIFLSALFLIGITFFTGFSWLKLFKALSNLVWLGVAKLASSIWGSITERMNRPRDENIEGNVDKTRKGNEVALVKQRVEPVLERYTPEIEDNSLSSNEPRILPLQKTNGVMPDIALLAASDNVAKKSIDKDLINQISKQVEIKLQDFGVDAQVVSVHPGPVVSRFELQLAPGVKASKVSGLSKDLARSLLVPSVRVVEVIPGKSVIGLELPNDSREVVRLREIIESDVYQKARSVLSLALGKDIAGYPIVVDLGKMPHLLVAGTTGSGKSVGINAMLLSFLYKASPEDVRLLLIDPKMLELSVYEGIPHLLTPVITDMKDAISALRWCVNEMEQRYRLMASLGVRNLAGYNKKIKEAEKNGEKLPDPFFVQEENLAGTEPPHLEKLPYIVVVIDELADMMMVVGKKVDQLIARIAQKARAAGIHLILSTQRPSVDVITGLIKANIPTRIAFQVSSKIDSRTILDQQGAEHLLGHGDMLYLPPGSGIPMRVHGALVEDDEVHSVVAALKEQAEPNYFDGVLDASDGENSFEIDKSFDFDIEKDEESDELYDKAVYIVTESRKASISHIQRRLKIGYNRAARLIETMEKAGIVSEMENNGSRSVLAPSPPKN